MANTGGELAYLSHAHAGRPVDSPSSHRDGANAAQRTPKLPLVAVDGACPPRKVVHRVTTLLTDQDDGFTVLEMCERLGETSDVIRATLAPLLLSGRVRRLGARRHTRYVLNCESR